MTQSAKALVLDFGGVISRTLFETHHLTELALGLAPGSLDWRGPFDLSSDPLWCSMQANEITERAYWQQRTIEVGRLTGFNWTEMSDFVIAARGADPLPIIRPEALSAISKSKLAKRKLAVLSNELDLFYGADFRDKLPFLNDFDAIIDATYTGILKPDVRAYSQAVDGLGLDAGACVFVDDQPRNIEGARAFGMQCVQFDVMNPAESYQKALSLLGL